jgi:hypothetical protein
MAEARGGKPSLPRILKDASLRPFFREFVTENHDDAMFNFYEATLDYEATTDVRRPSPLSAAHASETPLMTLCPPRSRSRRPHLVTSLPRTTGMLELAVTVRIRLANSGVH